MQLEKIELLKFHKFISSFFCFFLSLSLSLIPCFFFTLSFVFSFLQFLFFFLPKLVPPAAISFLSLSYLSFSLRRCFFHSIVSFFPLSTYLLHRNTAFHIPLWQPAKFIPLFLAQTPTSCLSLSLSLQPNMHFHHLNPPTASLCLSLLHTLTERCNFYLLNPLRDFSEITCSFKSQWRRFPQGAK